MNVYAVDKLIEQARQLATEFRKTTGKPLPGVSNEIAEYDASSLLGLSLCEDRTAGFDAVRDADRGPQRVQIKARSIFNDNYRGQRLGQLKIDKTWDSVVLVLLDDQYEPFDIYEACRDDILENLSTPSEGRKKRGAMSVARFINISQLVWSREAGLIEDIWQDYHVNH